MLAFLCFQLAMCKYFQELRTGEYLPGSASIVIFKLGEHYGQCLVCKVSPVQERVPRHLHKCRAEFLVEVALSCTIAILVQAVTPACLQWEVFLLNRSSIESWLACAEEEWERNSIVNRTGKYLLVGRNII